jgi:hypothetical protein
MVIRTGSFAIVRLKVNASRVPAKNARWTVVMKKTLLGTVSLVALVGSMNETAHADSRANGGCGNAYTCSGSITAPQNLTNQLALYADFQGEFSYVSQSYGGKAGMKYWW